MHPDRSFTSHRQALALCAVSAVVVLSCTALIIAAALAPAPTAVLPFVVLCCVLAPLALSWDVPAAVATLRRRSDAVAELRRQLAALPEAPHPLGH
jgi:hypothetical protein